MALKSPFNVQSETEEGKPNQKASCLQFSSASALCSQKRIVGFLLLIETFRVLSPKQDAILPNKADDWHYHIITEII